jgi:hypothetical protein
VTPGIARSPPSTALRDATFEVTNCFFSKINGCKLLLIPPYSIPHFEEFDDKDRLRALRLREPTQFYALCARSYSKFRKSPPVERDFALGNILTKIVRNRTDIEQIRAYIYAHTTSRVAEAGVSFPTDLEKYTSAPAFKSAEF